MLMMQQQMLMASAPNQQTQFQQLSRQQMQESHLYQNFPSTATGQPYQLQKTYNGNQLGTSVTAGIRNTTTSPNQLYHQTSKAAPSQAIDSTSADVSIISGPGAAGGPPPG